MLDIKINMVSGYDAGHEKNIPSEYEVGQYTRIWKNENKMVSEYEVGHKKIIIWLVDTMLDIKHNMVSEYDK